MFKLKKVKNKK